MRVLVVEDQAELADSIGRVLRREGMAVEVCRQLSGPRGKLGEPNIIATMPRARYRI